MFTKAIVKLPGKSVINGLTQAVKATGQDDKTVN